MKKNDKELQMQFLLAEYESTINQRWKVHERHTEVFKFYITIISGFGGLFLTLLTLGRPWSEINTFVPIGCLMIFLLGIILLIQLVGIEKSRGRLNKRLGIVQKKISEIASLEDYFSELESRHAEYMVAMPRYTWRGLFLRAKRHAASKTQLIIINSLIGTVAIWMATVQFSNQLQILIPVTIISMILLVLLHVGIVSIIGRN